MKKKWGIYVRMLRGYKFMKAILYKENWAHELLFLSFINQKGIDRAAIFTSRFSRGTYCHLSMSDAEKGGGNLGGRLHW